MKVEEVAQELGVSKSYAYKIVQKLNEELKSKGFLTISGRVNKQYFMERTCYGAVQKAEEQSRNARLVGKILSRAELYGQYPCHRVVSSQGRLAPSFADQRRLLEQEGVTFKSNGNVDMKHRI